jgi:predicted O-methyltransferase YrrM
VHLPWRDVPAAGGGLPISTSLLAEEAALLAQLATGHTVLETGTAYGYSACLMAAAGALSVATVDRGDMGAGIVAWRNMAAYGVEHKISAVPGDSRLVLPTFAEQGWQFGLIFIDGDHTAAGVRNDVGWARELSEPGGIIAVHDYGEDCCCPDVRTVLDEEYPAGADELVGTLFVVKT